MAAHVYQVDYVAEMVAFAYLVLAWFGFASYARWRARRGSRPSLSRVMKSHRLLWSARLLRRRMRETDASLLANQESVVSFLASTTLIILAAVLTAISNAGQLAELSRQIPWMGSASASTLTVKLLLLLFIMVYAFFKVTWALRQYGFASALVGSAPLSTEAITEAERQRFVENLARLMDRAGHDSNDCLRAYYFGVAVVFWAAGNLAFVLATTAVVLVLAEREFTSTAVVCIEDAQVELRDD